MHEAKIAEKENTVELIKNKEYFVGIDSDGTVFDSMKIKHTDSFIPAAIEIFDLRNCEEMYKEAAERINLYSDKRGINRFPGLLLALLEMKEKGLWNDDVEELAKYVDSGYALSNIGLEQWLKDHPSDFMLKVLAWSKLGDLYFEKYTQNIQPFYGVTSAIKYMNKTSDIMVVSAASGAGLQKDWGNTGLLDDISFVAGQEFGNKARQLAYARNSGYKSNNMLMIGDAPGDYDAAKEVGAWFYPIIPGQESKCWKNLHDVYYEQFISNKYDEALESSLYRNFLDVLTKK